MNDFFEEIEKIGDKIQNKLGNTTISYFYFKMHFKIYLKRNGNGEKFQGLEKYGGKIRHFRFR